MLGDTAVAVHPDDERYATSSAPRSSFRSPVAASPLSPTITSILSSAPARSGTPARPEHRLLRRHNLPSLIVLDERGNITANGPFLGLDRFEARPAVVAAPQNKGASSRRKRPYLHSVGHAFAVTPSSRSGCRCSGSLALRCWLERRRCCSRRTGHYSPTSMEPRFFGWTTRCTTMYQPGWGTAFRCGSDRAARSSASVRARNRPPATGGRRTPTSSTPGSLRRCGRSPRSAGRMRRRSSRSSIHQCSCHRLRHPSSGRPDDDVRALRDGRCSATRHRPLCTRLRPHGKKMSKSRGNTADPIAWMDTYGTDAMRFTFARRESGAGRPGRGGVVQGARNFCNKLWNAARFALINGASTSSPLPSREPQAAPIDGSCRGSSR